mgnify:CR=1 FL=1
MGDRISYLFGAIYSNDDTDTVNFIQSINIDGSADTESEGCACVGELGKDLNIVASTISHHMKELRQAGLVRMERRGQRIECWRNRW